MEQFIWLMDQLKVLAEWRSASMECGEQCVRVAGITMMPELCADNWGTVSTQVKVGSCIGKRIGDVTRRQVLLVWQFSRSMHTEVDPAIFLVFIHGILEFAK